MIEELHWVLANFISYFAECSLNSQWNRKAFLFIFASTDIFVWKRRNLEYISNNKKDSLEQKNVKEIKEKKKPTQKSIEICERNREYLKVSSNRKIFFVPSIKEMVFCYQNCSDLLWEKIVLVIEKNFWNLRLKAENLQKIWDHKNNLFKQWKVRTIFGNRMFF